jgi:hypothetical protein
MSNSNPNINKGSVEQSLFESSIDRIFVVRPQVGDSFSGMLKRIQNNRLVFEKRNGTTVIIDEDNILSAVEVHSRRQ